MQNKESQKKSNELLLCPFCGGEAKIDCYLYFDEFDDWFIRCTSCFCRTRTFKTKKSAIITWNTRKPLERIAERLEEQAEECRKYWREFDDEDSFGGMNAYCDAVKIVKEEGGMNE